MKVGVTKDTVGYTTINEHKALAYGKDELFYFGRTMQTNLAHRKLLLQVTSPETAAISITSMTSLTKQARGPLGASNKFKEARRPGSMSNNQRFKSWCSNRHCGTR